MFFLGRAVDLVIEVRPDARHVGGNLDGVQAIDVGEFGRLGHGGAGHAGQLGIEPKIVLEGDRGEGLGFLLNRSAFLGLQGLVQAVAIAPAFHHAAGEFVDDDDPVVFDDVVGVALEERVRAQGDVGVVELVDVLDVEQRTALDQAVLAE